MPKSHVKGTAVASLAVDAASLVYSAWISGGQLSPVVSYWDIQVDLATTATLGLLISNAATTSGVFATTTLNGSANITAGQLVGFTVMARASFFYNFQPSATTTFREFVVNERYDW